VGRLLGLGPRARRDAGLDFLDPVAIARPGGHHRPAVDHSVPEIWQSAKTRQGGNLYQQRKKMAAAPHTRSGRQERCLTFRRGEGQATSVLKRSALAVARLESGWNASPASFTSDSV